VKELLLPNPDSELIKKFSALIKRPHLVPDIRRATKMAYAVKGTKVRWYDGFIHHSINLVDVEKSSGWVHVESVFPYSGRGTRPSYTVKKTESEEAVKEISRMFREMWDEAKDAPR
jgi:hypothetical protein